MQGIVFISKFKEKHFTERSLCDAIKHLILFLKLWICPVWGDVLNNISMCEAGPAECKNVVSGELRRHQKNVLTFFIAWNRKWSFPLTGSEKLADWQ